MGKAVFVFEVRADISSEERGHINKYKLGDGILYEKSTLIDKGSGLLGAATRMVHAAMNITVTVNDLANGRKIECKDILEMLAVEDQIKEAAVNFKAVLDAAAHFGGEEVIEL
jgi:hypothetical protein